MFHQHTFDVRMVSIVDGFGREIIGNTTIGVMQSLDLSREDDVSSSVFS